MAGRIGAIWGIAGLLLMLGSGIYRLGPPALVAFYSGFHWFHWTAWVCAISIMAYAEGYRGFQLNLSPRVAARMLYLREHPKLLHVIFAPLFCLGYFHATRRRRMISYYLSIGIIGLVFAVGRLPQPWRGIVDAGVVTGLAWGIISILCSATRALAEGTISCSPEVPES